MICGVLVLDTTGAFPQSRALLTLLPALPSLQCCPAISRLDGGQLLLGRDASLLADATDGQTFPIHCLQEAEHVVQ